MLVQSISAQCLSRIIFLSCLHLIFPWFPESAIASGRSSQMSFTNVNLRMREGLPANSVIFTNLADAPELRSLNLPRGLDQVINDQKSFFEVLTSGEVRVRRELDRESLCGSFSKCCGADPECLLQAEVYISHSVLTAIRLVVNVSDENDERPRFDSPLQVVRVSESAPIDTIIALRPATDADVTVANRIRRYVFEELTHTFQLGHNSDYTYVYVKVKNRLDYERQANYSATLSACDLNYCAHQRLAILVQDENDNRPQFDRADYTVLISEDISHGQRLTQVHASDADDGVNGQVVYSFTSNLDADTLNTFFLNETSGEIFLRNGKRLSGSVRNEYRMEILATDRGQPPQSSMKPVPVVIHVKDVNDHAPEITIISSNAGKQPIIVPENRTPGVIVSLRVTDLDQGQNARFSCRLEPSGEVFRLTQQSEEFYALETLRPFNYEVQSEYAITMRCKDFGEPLQESSLNLRVMVQDVNEFPPTFERTNYEIRVLENLPSDQEVLTVRATDGDKSAQLRYRLDGDLGARYFTIDPLNGRLQTSGTPVNRESLDRFNFLVYVQDSDSGPTFTASCSIQVTVLDVNDNAPVWTNVPVYQVKENSPRDFTFGESLQATDDDVGPNAQVRYYLLNTFAQPTSSISTSPQKVPNTYFQITESGEVKTVGDIDREVFTVFHLEVEAVDRGESPLFSVTNVTVQVQDENDNAPIWLNPLQRMAPHAVVNVTEPSLANRRGVTIFILRADDKDEGENARMKYSLRKESTYFHVNQTTGEITTRTELDAASYTLHLVATDGGSPALSSQISLTFLIVGHDLSYLSLLIILIMISLTLCVAGVLLMTIVCIRRKSHQHRRHGSTTGSQRAQQNSPVISHRFYAGMSDPSLSHLVGDLDFAGENMMLSSTPQFPLHHPMHQQQLAWGNYHAYNENMKGANDAMTDLSAISNGRDGGSGSEFMAKNYPADHMEESQKMHPLMVALGQQQYYTLDNAAGSLVPSAHSCAGTDPNMIPSRCYTGYEMDGESGDSGRGGSEHGGEAGHLMQLPHSVHTLGTGGRGFRGFGNLQRPHRVNTPPYASGSAARTPGSVWQPHSSASCLPPRGSLLPATSGMSSTFLPDKPSIAPTFMMMPPIESDSVEDRHRDAFYSLKAQPPSNSTTSTLPRHTPLPNHGILGPTESNLPSQEMVGNEEFLAAGQCDPDTNSNTSHRNQNLVPDGSPDSRPVTSTFGPFLLHRSPKPQSSKHILPPLVRRDETYHNNDADTNNKPPNPTISKDN